MFKRLKKLCKLEKLASSSFFFSFFFNRWKSFHLDSLCCWKQNFEIAAFLQQTKERSSGLFDGFNDG
jgi:hypothetical protein